MEIIKQSLLSLTIILFHPSSLIPHPLLSRSNAEFISKIEGGLQELEETIYWLELLIESELVPAQKLNSLMQEADELIAILVTCVKNIKQDKNDRKRMKDEKVDG